MSGDTLSRCGKDYDVHMSIISFFFLLFFSSFFSLGFLSLMDILEYDIWGYMFGVLALYT